MREKFTTGYMYQMFLSSNCLHKPEITSQLACILVFCEFHVVKRLSINIVFNKSTMSSSTSSTANQLSDSSSFVTVQIGLITHKNVPKEWFFNTFRNIDLSAKLIVLREVPTALFDILRNKSLPHIDAMNMWDLLRTGIRYDISRLLEAVFEFIQHKGLIPNSIAQWLDIMYKFSAVRSYAQSPSQIGSINEIINNYLNHENLISLLQSEATSSAKLHTLVNGTFFGVSLDKFIEGQSSKSKNFNLISKICSELRNNIFNNTIFGDLVRERVFGSNGNIQTHLLTREAAT